MSERREYKYEKEEITLDTERKRERIWNGTSSLINICHANVAMTSKTSRKTIKIQLARVKINELTVSYEASFPLPLRS